MDRQQLSWRVKGLAKKPVRRAERIRVVYDEKRWRLLQELRRKAERIMEALESFNLPCIVHGSIARGDVSEKSDIDIFTLVLVSLLAL